MVSLPTTEDDEVLLKQARRVIAAVRKVGFNRLSSAGVLCLLSTAVGVVIQDECFPGSSYEHLVKTGALIGNGSRIALNEKLEAERKSCAVAA